VGIDRGRWCDRAVFLLFLCIFFRVDIVDVDVDVLAVVLVVVLVDVLVVVLGSAAVAVGVVDILEGTLLHILLNGGHADQRTVIQP